MITRDKLLVAAAKKIKGARMNPEKLVRWFSHISMRDLPEVGGKNSSLGEMKQRLASHHIPVPDGFATTASAFRLFLDANGLTERINAQMSQLDESGRALRRIGSNIRAMVLAAKIPSELAGAIRSAYADLSKRYKKKAVDVAVRSSATAEDLPDASFAGAQESYLNIRGEADLLQACRMCFASLYTDRAISYRRQKGYDKTPIALSIGIQKMVRSDRAASGVIFTIDTETGFPGVIVVTSAWGLGECVVKGTVTPDEFLVFKSLLDQPRLEPIIQKTRGAKAIKMVHGPRGRKTKTVATSPRERQLFSIHDDEVMTLARWAKAIESHYGRPMDIEWAKDGASGELFIVQARPETVQSRRSASVLKSYQLLEKTAPLISGTAVGTGIAAGKAIAVTEIGKSDGFENGGILVTKKTDPDWVPLMKRAAGIVTEQGGRTSHAAIVSRELGLSAVVGAAGAISKLRGTRQVTLSCAEGDIGHVYPGALRYKANDLSLANIPQTRTKIMINLADPDAAFRWWSLPADGVGLARMEFIISNIIKIHPLALTRFEQVKDARARRQIDALTSAFKDRTEFFVDHLARGLAMLASPFYPHPVIVRLSDFKTNEYANLIGGRQFEPTEENPMLGFRGASRYYHDNYRDGFALECLAIKRAREKLGLKNIIAMVPFCRTPEEADRVLATMASNGLTRGKDGFEIYVMAEIPSNVILAEEFAHRFDGFSIGSNDLTQLLLGVDRDSSILSGLFNERHRAVIDTIRQLIARAHACNRKVGICGQAPSDHPGFAEMLVEAGIDSISVNPDSLIRVRRNVAAAEKRL